MKAKTKGIIASSGVLLFQGWESIIIMFFAFLGLFAGVFTSPAFTSASLFAKEIFTFVISAMIFGNKKLIQIFKNGFTLDGLKYGIAFIIGSTLGTTFLLLAVVMAGAGYGVVLTATYPIFTILIIRIFFKEKSNKVTYLGIALTIIGGALFMILPSLYSGDEFTTEKLVGVSFGALTALCWASEGVILNHIHTEKSRFTDKDLTVWKSFVSLMFIAIVIMPIAMAFDNSYTIFANILSSWQAVLIVTALAINLLTVRLLYTLSIKNAGVRLTSIIDTNNFLVGPIISTILFYALDLTYANDSSKPLFENVIWWSWFLLIPILVGVMIVIVSSKKKAENLQHDI